jgi:hypothetical protein
MKWTYEHTGYEGVHKTRFGDCEVTIVEFNCGGYVAWVKKTPSVSTILKYNYPMNYGIENVKEDFMMRIKDYLFEQAIYWDSMFDSLLIAQRGEE